MAGRVGLSRVTLPSLPVLEDKLRCVCEQQQSRPTAVPTGDALELERVVSAAPEVHDISD